MLLSIRDDRAEVIQLNTDERAANFNQFTVRFSTRSQKQLDNYYQQRNIFKIGKYMLENHAELQDAIESDALQTKYCCMMRTVTSAQYQECLEIEKESPFR